MVRLTTHVRLLPFRTVSGYSENGCESLRNSFFTDRANSQGELLGVASHETPNLCAHSLRPLVCSPILIVIKRSLRRMLQGPHERKEGILIMTTKTQIVGSEAPLVARKPTLF